MRTIETNASTPLFLSFAVVAAPLPWQRSRLEFAVCTGSSEGVRLCFSNPHDVRMFAAAVRRFAADCRDLEHLRLVSPSPRRFTSPRRAKTRDRNATPFLS
jgi:hypothetical protein